MIINTEFEYHLLSHLITMKDRQLAQKVELLIWPNSPISDPKVCQELAELVEISEGEDHLNGLLEEYVKNSGKEFLVGGLDGKTITTTGPRSGEWKTLAQALGYIITRLKQQPEEKWSDLANALTPMFGIFTAESEK